MKAYLFVSKKNINKKGLCPIVCRIASKDGNRVDFRTGKFITPDAWDAKHGLPITNDLDIITGLHHVLNTVYGIISERKRNGGTVYEVLQDYNRQRKRPPATIGEIAALLLDDANATSETRLKISTVAEQFDNLLNKPNPARVSSVTLNDFALRLRQKGYAATTISKKFEFLKRVFVYATGKQYISANPFATFMTPKAPKLEPVRLSEDEINCLAGYTFASDRLNKVRDLFLFQCYTGLSYKDIWNVGYSNIELQGSHKFLRGTRAKTNEIFYLPWLEQAQAFADKYNFQFEHISNQKYNSYLKEIGEITGLSKTLTTHVGRKTFAQMMIDKGYSAEAVSRMVGHTSFNMTQKHYARIGEARIINETSKMTG